MASGVRPIIPRPLRPQPATGAHEQPIADEVPPKRRRTGRPKSRSGCLTCKSRRVKCDERLPTCARCEKAKVVCEGYAIRRRPSDKTSRKIGALQALAPRPLDPSPKDLCALQLAGSRLPRTLSGMPVIEGPDVVYFDLFRYRVATDLAAGYYTELWSTAISEGLYDGYVRDSILAIGALAQAISYTDKHATTAAGRPTSWSHQRRPTNEHHRTSLQHHLRAVAGFRTFIGDSTVLAQPRKVFIMTLLLIVYEMLQGHVSGADRILNCGMAVFRNSITLFHDTEAKANKTEMEDIEHALPRLAVMGLFTHRFNSAWAYLHHLRVQPEFKFPKPGVDSLSKVFAYWGRFYTLAVTSLCQTAHESFTAPKTTARQAKFLRGLRQWKSILEHYLEKSDTSPEDKRALQLTLLHWDVVWISISCSLDLSGVAFDAFTTRFRGLLCRSVQFIEGDLASDAPPRLMMFGEGILMPLLFIVTCCRDHDLRMAAATTAYRLPWQEGTWDTRVVLLAHLGGVLMEESGRDADGWIPPSSRWYWRGGQVEPGTDEMTANYVRHEPDENGEPVAQTLKIDLGQWPEICSTVGCRKDHTRLVKMGDLGQTLDVR
ncbi:hypothetical protein ACJ41O_010386 [Fusarium nematophilum]